MTLCSYNHDEVCHDNYRHRPLCQMRQEKDDEIQTLQQRIRELEREIEEKAEP